LYLSAFLAHSERTGQRCDGAKSAVFFSHRFPVLTGWCNDEYHEKGTARVDDARIQYPGCVSGNCVFGGMHVNDTCDELKELYGMDYDSLYSRVKRGLLRLQVMLKEAPSGR
jgi:hypothetical protein